MSIDGLLDEQNRAMDARLLQFERELEAVVRQALARTVANIQGRLAVEDGEIKGTPGNMQIVRRADQVFLAEMEAAGYSALLDRFVSSFNDGLPFFQEVLEVLSADIPFPLEVDFTARDLRLFASQQLNTVAQLEAEVQRVAVTAKRQVLFSVAGLSTQELAHTLARELGRSVSQVIPVADTAMSTFYRTVQDRGFRHIEEGLPDGTTVQYQYYGPLDKLTRPFCKRYRKATGEGKSWTRKQIDLMDNGTDLPVMTCGGGWRCRHQWIIKGISSPGE